MAKFATKLVSKFSFIPYKRQFKHIPVPVDDIEDIEDFRSRGCEILKAISIDSESTNTANTDTTTTTTNRYNYDYAYSNSGDCIEMDWHETIQKVSEFQQQQQHQIEDENEKKSAGGNDRQHKANRLKFLKRALDRRKKFDNKGSFAINMVTYQDNNNNNNNNTHSNNSNKNDGKNNDMDCPTASSSGSISGCDDRSRSSISTCVSNDFTLRVIDEETAYYNTS